MAKKVICKECKKCLWLSYNCGGQISIDCLEHEGPDGMLHYEVTECDDFELPDYDTKCWDDNGYFKSDLLPDLRSQICLGSIYTDDYYNSYGINPSLLCDFFDSYDNWLTENNKEESPENLVDWYLNYCDFELTKDTLISL